MVKEFHRLQDDLKIIWKKLTPGCRKYVNLKNGVITNQKLANTIPHVAPRANIAGLLYEQKKFRQRKKSIMLTNFFVLRNTAKKTSKKYFPKKKNSKKNAKNALMKLLHSPTATIGSNQVPQLLQPNQAILIM